jgi:hypothetical protein
LEPLEIPAHNLDGHSGSLSKAYGIPGHVSGPFITGCLAVECEEVISQERLVANKNGVLARQVKKRKSAKMVGMNSI